MLGHFKTHNVTVECSLKKLNDGNEMTFEIRIKLRH
jgi:hypothetical protein